MKLQVFFSAILTLGVISCQETAIQENKRTQPSSADSAGIGVEDDETKFGDSNTQPNVEIIVKDDYWNQDSGDKKSDISNIKDSEVIKNESSCTENGYFWLKGSCLQNHLWFIWDDSSCLAQNSDRQAITESCDVIKDTQQFVYLSFVQGSCYRPK